MMKQAQEMQERLQREMSGLLVQATSGGGMVTVTVNGHKHLQKITIDPEVVSKDDIGMLQDLIVAAVNDAHRKVDEAMKQKMGGLLGGLALLLLPLVRSMRRATELFRLKLRDGQVHFVRGRIPHALLQDLGDVARSSQIARADVWALRRDGRAELRTRGELTPEQLQRLRNVIASYSLQRILAGARPARR